MKVHVFLLLFSILIPVNARTLDSHYRPVFLIHGFVSSHEVMEFMSKRIQKMHPRTIVYNTKKYENFDSLTKMWKQVEDIGQDVLDFGAKYPDGINLLGYSQGGLIARAILQRFPEHNVRNFISLSAPLAGQYGDDCLHLFYSDLIKEMAYKLLYTKLGQDMSLANYWKDPTHLDLYYEYSQFLPYIDNEKQHDRDYKTGLTKLNRLVLIGGPDDGVITPWQSSQFGFFDSNMNVAEMWEQHHYIKDTIGLKTLASKQKIIFITLVGINHFQWHKNNSIIDDYILPYLD